MTATDSSLPKLAQKPIAEIEKIINNSKRYSKEDALKMFDKQKNIILSAMTPAEITPQFSDKPIFAADGLQVELMRRYNEVNEYVSDLRNILIRRYDRGVKVQEDDKAYRMSVHGLKQLFAKPKHQTLFSQERVITTARDIGESLQNIPNSYGAILNQSQRDVFLAVVRAFSDTNYQGHKLLPKKEELKNNREPEDSQRAEQKLEFIYKNIPEIPEIAITQADLLRLSGFDTTSWSDKTLFTNALNYLGTNKFCFYWERLKYDANNKPVKHKNGDLQKETVMEVAPILRVRYITDENQQLQYYQITLSAAMLDQVNNHFLLIPANWQAEVKEIAGKRASKYTYEFLLWLRLEFEKIRSHNAKPKSKKRDFIIRTTWDEIACELKMPKSLYTRNRARASKLIDEAYQTAIKLNYLKRVEKDAVTDILYLNEDYYPQPGKLT